MQILDFAIMCEGSTSKLAATLGVWQTAVSNWKARGVPRAWQQLLEARYGRRYARFQKTQSST